jgi:hypothetical protein
MKKLLLRNIFYFILDSIQGFPGNATSHDTQASGAYIFRPSAQTPLPVSTTRTV